MPITDWPNYERPREKMLTSGPKNLSDAELLAIILRTGRKGKTAVDLAREILKQYGNIRFLLDAKREECCTIAGMGLAKFIQLQAALEIAKRYLQHHIERHDVLACAEDTKYYLKAQLRAYKHEVFSCLFLDARNRIISFDELFHGTIDSAPIYPRNLVKRALEHNASAVIFAHNHPSGVATPSQADMAITKQLKAALEAVEIRVLDHMIVGDNEIISFAELGLLD